MKTQLTNDNCEIISKTIDQSTFTEVGAYSVVITVEDASNNIASSTATVTVINSIVSLNNPNSLNQNWTLYPNPTAGFLSIDASLSIKQINIYNRLGQLVLSNTNETTINLSKLAAGIYFCKVTNVDGDFEVRKVVKE